MNEFHGFSKSFFAFFRSLKANNERAWFEANKERFRATVQAQMSEFIAAMAPEAQEDLQGVRRRSTAERRFHVPHSPRRAVQPR